MFKTAEKERGFICAKLAKILPSLKSHSVPRGLVFNAKGMAVDYYIYGKWDVNIHLLQNFMTVNHIILDIVKNWT